VLEGAVLTIGEQALRPGEIFALHRPELHFEERLIHVKRQIALETGEITWPKDDDGGWVPMTRHGASTSNVCRAWARS
jgi:hypothetical protein